MGFVTMVTVQDDRYSRQVSFGPLGAAGQQRLGESHAILVGCGALGSVVAELLARAGVGRITIIDRDFVEGSNLARQLLFDERDAGEGIPKAIAAERRLHAVNSTVKIEAIVDDLRSSNAEELLGGADVLIDATDNFEARYLINDYAVKHGVSWIYGAAVGSYGITTPIFSKSSACFRCLYPEPPSGAQPTCETAGVLGSVTALVGSLQAAAALMILSGNSASIRKVITTVDVWHGPLREFAQPERDPDCPCCAHREFPWLGGENEPPVSLCGRNAVQIHASRGRVDLPELAQRLNGYGEVRNNDFALRFLLDSYEITVFPDGRAIIKGTTDIAVARSLYARWVSA